MPNKSCIVFFLVLLYTNLHAQRKLDSLLEVLNSYKKEDAHKLKLLNDVAGEYQYINYVKGMAISDSAIRLAQKLKITDGETLRIKGENTFRKGELKNALNFLQQSLAIETQNKNTYNTALCCNDLGNVYLGLPDYNLCIKNYHDALKLNEHADDKKAIAKTIRFISSYYNAVADYKTALDTLQTALAIDVKAEADSQEIAACYNSFGIIYKNLSDYPKSLDYLFKALRINEKLGYRVAVASNFNNLSATYTTLADYSTAIDYVQKALALNTELGNTQSIIQNLENLAYNYALLKDYAKGIEYAEKAIKICEETGIIKQLPYAYNALGVAYTYSGDICKAIDSYKKGVEIATQIGDKRTVAAGSYAIGDLFEEAPDSILLLKNVSPENRYDTAIKYYMHSKQIAEEMHDSKILSSNLKHLSICYEAQKKYIEAFDTYKKYIALRDSISNDSKRKEIEHLSMQYEFDKQSDSIKLQEQLTNEKLKQQVLLAKQQDQQLELGKKELALITKQKDIQKLAYLKTQADLQNEQLQKREKEKQLIIAQKEKKLQQANIEKQQYSNRIRTYSLIAMLAVFLLIAIILWRNNLQKQKANHLLVQQKHQTDAQKQKAEEALDELNATQNQLVQSEKMASLGELTAGIAHEIQNPLNFVNNFSQLNTELIEELEEQISAGNIEDAKSIADDLKQNMEKINMHGNRADSIVKAMLLHSRSSKGVKELTDINALAEEYLRLTYHGLRAKDKSFNTEIETDFDSVIQKINIVPQDIARVLLNLFNNAFYAVAEKSRQLGEAYQPIVAVSTKKIVSGSNHAFIELRVKDNGMGIPEKIINKIFEPFFTTKPTGQGTGLGLSLSYDIVTKGNGGSLRAETKQGGYAEFIMQLPMT